MQLLFVLSSLVAISVPSSPREFKPTCTVIAWNIPSEIHGELRGYELQFQFKNDERDTVYLGPAITHYETSASERQTGTRVRVRMCDFIKIYFVTLSSCWQVRASNTNNAGTWTSFYFSGMLKFWICKC